MHIDTLIQRGINLPWQSVHGRFGGNSHPGKRQLQVAQLSQRDRAAGCVSNGQKWKTGTERQYLRTI